MATLPKRLPAPVSQMAKPLGGGGVGSVLQQMQKPIPQVQPKPQVPPKPIPPRPTPQVQPRPQVSPRPQLPQVQPRPQIQPKPQVSPRPQLPQVASNPNMTQLNSNSQMQQLMKMLQAQGTSNPSQLSKLLGNPQVQQPSNPNMTQLGGPGVPQQYQDVLSAQQKFLQEQQATAKNTLGQIPAYNQIQQLQQQLGGRPPNPQQLQQLQALSQQIQNDPRMQQMQTQQQAADKQFQDAYGGQLDKMRQYEMEQNKPPGFGGGMGDIGQPQVMPAYRSGDMPPVSNFAGVGAMPPSDNYGGSMIAPYTGYGGPVNKNPLVDPVTGNTLPQLGTVDFVRGGFGGGNTQATTGLGQGGQNPYIANLGQALGNAQTGIQGGGMAGPIGGGQVGLGGGIGQPQVQPPQGGFGSPQSPYATGAMAAGMGGNMATPYNSGSPIGGSGSTQPFGQTMGKIGMNDGGFISSQNNMIPGDGFNNTSSSMQNLGLASLAFKYGGWVK